jgi:hypothetical protein
MLHRSVLLALALSAAGMTPAAAAESYVGKWAVDPARCESFGGDSATTATLVASESGLSWFAGYCRIGKMYKAGQAFYVEARCGNGVAIPVTLDPRGDRMRVSWNRGKLEEMRRCK